MDPVIYKEIVVAHSGTNFVNGDNEFDLTVADMDQIVKNFADHPRQVPLLLGGGHRPGPYRAEDPADGWVESLKRSGSDLVARVKLMGAAAMAVRDDTFRGISIGAYHIPDLHGNDVGLRLDHLLITNAGFFADLNIAAQGRTFPKSGGMPLLYLTASKETRMDPKKDEKPPEKIEATAADSLDLTEKLTAAECLLQEKDGVIRELTASNANLLEEVTELRKNTNLNLAQKRIDQLERNNLAEKVRRVVAKMRADGQIPREAIQGWYDNDSDEVVLSGFKNSQFKGKLDLLNYHRESVPKKPIDRTFISGAPADGEPGQYTAEEQKQIRDAGKDPELLAKTRGAKNFTEYKQRKAAAQKG